MQPDVQKNERDYLNGGLTPLMVAVKHKHVEATRKMVKFRWEWTHNLYQTSPDIIVSGMWTWTLWTLMGTVWSSWSRGWTAAGIRLDNHIKEELTVMFTFRNAELLYIIEAARKQREEEDLAAGGEQ